MSQVRHGDAYWISNCPPLDGLAPKRRPAVFLDLGDLVPPNDEGFLVFVAATTDEEIDLSRDPDAIWVECGLPAPCWVLPRWVVEVPARMLDGQAGRLIQPQLDQLIDAVVDRYFDFGDRDS